MLEVQNLREQHAAVVAGLGKRNIQEAENQVDAIIALDDERKALQQQYDDTQAQSNALSKQIGQLMKTGQREEAEKIKQQTSALKEEGKELNEKMQKVLNKLQQALYALPNVPNPQVPAGSGEEDNKEIERSGEVPVLGDSAKPHWELIKDYNIIDFELGVKVTGAGFPFYKGKGARLLRALVNFFLDEAHAQGYEEVQPPVVINEASGFGTGQLPDKDGQMYHIGEENFYLIPTAEVPITNMYRDVILNADQLPVKHVGYTPCFRREAGSWGAHVRGLNRLHQFDKVEIVQITLPEDSYNTLDQMCNYVKSLLNKLELPYRVLNLCAGDLGFTSAQTFDFEVFSAAQQKWLEVSSVSNFETFQANRLKLRYRNADRKTELLHTLNGSALALPRIVAALLENNQHDGYISVPKVLQQYTGFDRID